MYNGQKELIVNRQEMIDSLENNEKLGMIYQGYDQDQIEEKMLVVREILEDKTNLELRNLIMINC